MSRSSPRLPRVSGTFTALGPINDADWQRIEAAYGRKLSETLRDGIYRTTKFYVLAAASERQAEPVKNAEKLISAYQKATRNLITQMQRGGQSDAASYTQELVTNRFHDDRLRDDDDHPIVLRSFYSLLGVLFSFESACAGARSDLQRTGISGPPREWSRWIWDIAGILKENGLPTAVRKDAGSKSKSDKQSSFTLLVQELQKCLPKDCRDQLPYADGALPTALSSALASKKFGNQKASREA